MGPVQKSYLEKVHSGELQSDPVQVNLAISLDNLVERLATKSLSKKSSSLGWLFAKKAEKQPIMGLYIWGSVGRGKSMLMDLFFSHLENKRKRRVHFHEFMSDAQDRIAKHRKAFKEGETKEVDPMPAVARALASEASVLCFDEFTVTDIADAMILGRIFEGLFNAGVVVVATSNVVPDELYKDGLNRNRFLPFIDLLKGHCEICELDAPKDYRLDKLSAMPVYLAPLGPKATASFEALWLSATAGMKVEKAYIERKGRKINIPKAVRDIARFSFEDLCDVPLAAADYLAITKEYNTVFVENIPIMRHDDKNRAKRFILLIDALYDQHKRLVVSADANPFGLYQGKGGTETFEFQRTSSRLIEMQSQAYLSSFE